MAKIQIKTLSEAPLVELPQGFSGTAQTQAFFDRGAYTIEVYQHRLQHDASLRIGPKETDCVVYIWNGAVAAGGRLLTANSSLVVERGAAIGICGKDSSSVLLTFSAARPSKEVRAGGHVHLLPADRVPRAALAGTSGVSGALHADAGCPSCQVWLHENTLTAHEELQDAAASERGVHSHSEDEVIFVTDGEMRLGARLYGPGTAIAISADTLYSFSVGPNGLKFVNFRAGLPSEIKFRNGSTMDEVGFWRERLGVPQYLEPLPA